MQMRLWERMNLGAASYGQREMGNRYIPVRIEDFILPRNIKDRANTIIHLFRRLGVDISEGSRSSSDSSGGSGEGSSGSSEGSGGSSDDSSGGGSGDSSDSSDSSGSGGSSGGDSGEGSSEGSDSSKESIIFRKAKELSFKIFGSESLKSHFSITRWGGCDPEIIDEVETAGMEGLLHFGYLPWRQLQQEQLEDQLELVKKQGVGQDNGGVKKNSCSVGASQIQVPGVRSGGVKK